MGKNQKPAPRAELVSLDGRRGTEIIECLEDAFDEHTEFESILVVAVVNPADGQGHYCRVYSARLSHLEKLGLLQKAIETIA
jgi:flagellar biosynthesis/type III secretory pathway ATPase